MTTNKQPYDVYVISLIDSNRHTEVHTQLDNTGIEYELLMFKRTMTDQHPNYDAKTRLRRFGYPLLPGEIGCFDSHRACWEKVISTDRPAIILEDDFKFDDFKFLDSFINLAKVKKPLFIRLQGIFYKPFKKMIGLGELDLGTFDGDPAGTAGYFINPAAARKLYEASQSFFQAVDDFVCNEALHQCLVTGLQPYPVVTNEAPSTIGTRNKPRLTIGQKLSRELSKALPSISSHWDENIRRPTRVKETLQWIRQALEKGR